MCYSAMVKQELKKLGIRYDARVDLSLLEDLFERRNQGKKIALSKALEFNFRSPTTAAEKQIAKSIEEYKFKQILQLETDLFTQLTRFNKAVESFEKKATKKVENEKGVSERQIARIKKRLEKLKSDKLAENDARIYAFDWAPVIIWKDNNRVIVPMRYHLRPPDMPETFDRKYPGCYNARRDSLTGFWKNEFGKKHAILIISSFFENVKRHDFEKRALLPNEAEENMILQFKPKGLDTMVVPCIWDTWKGSGVGKVGFDSFALITDEPPVEVLETGHDRCPIFLNEARIDDWLKPQGKPVAELFTILDDRQRPFYEHALAG
jgi:putative SOS response-associated peptidase YedK